MPDNLISTIESILSQKVVRKQAIGGGCIADNYLLETQEGDKYFLKTGCHKQIFINYTMYSII